jgi:hypothetical protein
MEVLHIGERKAFVQNWYKEHKNRIFPWLGSPADENRLQFLNGIFFAPSFVKKQSLNFKKCSWPTHAIYTLVIHTLPIAEEMGMDDETNKDEGKEGSVKC